MSNDDRTRSLSQIERQPQREPRLRRISSDINPGIVTAITDRLFTNFPDTANAPEADAGEKIPKRDRTMNGDDFAGAAGQAKRSRVEEIPPNANEVLDASQKPASIDHPPPKDNESLTPVKSLTKTGKLPERKFPIMYLLFHLEKSEQQPMEDKNRNSLTKGMACNLWGISVIDHCVR